MTCPSCGHDNKAGAKFCGNCGAALALACPSCGEPYEAGQRFCNECGSALETAAAAATTAPSQPSPPPRHESGLTAERRLVSVLFADLVGFTSLSESRDAEEVRELLTRYFELARTLIERYGGTVEKFIGDAVMAVWGTPTATEDDAERAVRAALDLLDSVPELDPTLQARAGVLTGEAAVTVGAEGQGMVAGDLVNTASRIQSAAEPGTTLVGESTRRATEQAIVYEPAGEHELKGKAEPVGLWRALRVVSGVGGQLKSVGLEAPFVGRDRELKLIKELFHATADEKKPHLVSVTGIAGIGKSRLAWEFYKYFDGIVDTVWWHRGRCLSYGEGVAYWALADMVRMRARIAEDEDPARAREKLQATLEEHLLDTDERRFVEPRLAQLIGLEDGLAADRQDLFAAWRLFFERLADAYPCVLCFEDMQWADASLLDFVEYLLEWSRDYPIYVIMLARPELHERRPGWGAGQRSFTSLYLEPLSQQAMDTLLEGLVPGLPDPLRQRILARSEGVPLYAVETVRMLLDRALLVQDGPVYRPAGEIETLEVPETLHALIAARLDGVAPDERRLLQDGAVLGKTFSPHALAAVSGQPEAELQPLLASLVRKEVLGVQADPRSPEHGQYGFLQDLVRHVAYETLAKRDRRERHLAAAQHLERAFADEDEVAEVLASHYLAAYDAAPEADRAQEIRSKARLMLTRAGARAGSLGAPEEGRRYYAQAAELADEPRLQAELIEKSGRLSVQANHQVEARQRLEQAVELSEQADDPNAVARATASLADVDYIEGRLDDAVARLEQVVAQLERATPSAELAEALAQLGRMRLLSGREEAVAPLEQALSLAERLVLPHVFVEALTSKGLTLLNQGRLLEARILLEAARSKALDEELYASALRAGGNLAVVLESSDRFFEAVELGEQLLVLARRRGDRYYEIDLEAGFITSKFELGRWGDALADAASIADAELSETARMGLIDTAVIYCERGQIERAQAMLASAKLGDAGQPQVRLGYAGSSARVLRAAGADADALAAAEPALSFRNDVSVTSLFFKRVLVEALEAALNLGDLEKCEEFLAIPASLDAGELTPSLQANAARLRARLDAGRGLEDGVDERFRSAAGLFREFGLLFRLAITLLEHAEWLSARGSGVEGEPLAAEAREIFERLQATPWLERVARLAGASAEPEPVPS